MHIGSKTATVVLTLVTGLSALATPTPLAMASTGGASAPSTTTPSPAPATHVTSTAAKVRPSGVATWFGPGFYGKKTACGQTLTPSVIGLANRTLPCGTLVKVVYRNRAITIPVLDRGPYSHIADWDLTAGAARALGVADTVRIKTRVVGQTANSPSLGMPAPLPAEALSGGAVAG
jgi:rare lipoprotein A (peptidoglycan hydrolase)